MTLEKMMGLPWITELLCLGHTAVNAGTSEQAFDGLLAHIVNGFDADSGALALRANGSDSLRLVSGIGLPAEALGSVIAAGEGILGWVAQQAQPLLLQGSVDDDARFRRRRRQGDSHAPDSALCWPLVALGHVVGAFSLNRYASRPRFGQGDLQQGKAVVDMIALVVQAMRAADIQRQSFESLAKAHDQLKALNQKLESAQQQLLQSEKMASVGLLAAGVAHEINNPVGYVSSNLRTLERYVNDLFGLIERYEQAEPLLASHPEALNPLRSCKQAIDLAFLREDARALSSESREGLDRVKRIVDDLKNFSRADSHDEWMEADLHAGLESTINVVWNELKYKAEVRREYGTLPLLRCLPRQLNQVFLNILVNAGQAISEHGVITIRTGVNAAHVWVEITDTGQGIAPENLKRIFDPFFTTKAVGKGTGLGLSVSYGIVHKHGGEIQVNSTVGQGTTFRVVLPLGGAFAQPATA